jgi:hypothetical protein
MQVRTIHLVVPQCTLKLLTGFRGKREAMRGLPAVHVVSMQPHFPVQLLISTQWLGNPC